jgi:hypothetical protein
MPSGAHRARRVKADEANGRSGSRDHMPARAAVPGRGCERPRGSLYRRGPPGAGLEPAVQRSRPVRRLRGDPPQQQHGRCPQTPRTPPGHSPQPDMAGNPGGPQAPALNRARARCRSV